MEAGGRLEGEDEASEMLCSTFNNIMVEAGGAGSVEACPGGGGGEAKPGCGSASGAPGTLDEP